MLQNYQTYIYKIENWEKWVLTCGPRISAHALPLDGELDFYLENDFYF